MFQLQPTSIPVIVEVLQTCVIITALVTSLASLGVAIYAARISLKSATAASLPKALHERTSDNLDNISRKAIPALNNLAEQPKHRDGGPSEQHGTDAQHQAQSRAASRTADPPDARSLMEPIQLLVDHCKELLDLVGPDGIGPNTQIQALKNLLDEEVEHVREGARKWIESVNPVSNASA